MTRVLLGFACLAFAAAAACSSSTVITGDALSDGGTSNPSEDSGGGSSSSSGSSGSVVDGGATNDAGSSGGGGGSGKLYPIAVGNTWTYDVAALGSYPSCAAGSHSQTVMSGPTTLDGKQAYAITNFCSAITGTQPVSPDPTSDAVYFYYNDTWLTFVSVPLTDGATWTYFNSSYTWQRETSVTVPAGTFTDCWTAKQNVTYTAYLTYCRGVGMVRSYSSDLTGSGWDAKLSSKSF